MTSGVPAGRSGPRDFARLLRSEWTKFRTVRGQMAGTLTAALLVVLFAVLAAASGPRSGPVPVSATGEPVSDSSYLLSRELTGDGSITVSVTELQEAIATGDHLRDGTVPWAKAGLIIRADTDPGSAYVTIMVTGGHGIRMQDNFTHDRAGLPGGVSPATPRWLRLNRSGSTITTYDSVDGTHWSRVGSADLPGLPATVHAGLFAACPPVVQGRGTAPGVTTAAFGHPELRGDWSPSPWTGTQIGADTATFAGYPPSRAGGFTETDSGFTVTGSGDIAPAAREEVATGGVVGELLTGTFAAVVVVIVVGTRFITAEYRQGLIRSTLAANPRRGRVLTAKALVLASVTFVTGLVAAVVAVAAGEKLARAHGVYLFPLTPAARLRVEVGTAALLAACAVLAFAVGAVVRNGAAAIAAVTGAMVLPYLLVSLPFLPAGGSEWLARVTPTAAFAVQQTLAPLPQVDSIYTPSNGYYPLGAGAGLAVLCSYAAVTLGAAVVRIHRRDA